MLPDKATEARLEQVLLKLQKDWWDRWYLGATWSAEAKQLLFGEAALPIQKPAGITML